MPAPPYRKSRADAPRGYFAWEAAGLRWLATAQPQVVVAVVDVGDHHLDLQHLDQVPPTSRAAYELGMALAHLHDAGAPGWGAPPQGWTGDGFLGPLSEPLPLTCRVHPSWGAFYAIERLEATIALDRPGRRLPADLTRAVHRLAERVADGRFDTDDAPSRLHGDLWSGNLLWTPRGGVLIDPAAHGGHRETDLAMLQLFGVPHWLDLLAGYQAVRPLATGWRERVDLHQVHPLLMHAVLFGGGYAGAALRAVTSYL